METAIYFVVAEALTNVAKYATRLGRDGHGRSERRTASTVEIADDGAGGADVTAGSGLRGLEDRVAALDGRLELTARPAAGRDCGPRSRSETTKAAHLSGLTLEVELGGSNPRPPPCHGGALPAEL